MKTLLLWILLPLFLLQFIRMDVPETLSYDHTQTIDAPVEVMRILKRSCYDCHSNALTYPWYAKIAPLSWYIQRHVQEGREVLNFSQWKSYNTQKQHKLLRKLPKSLRVRMPLPDYLWLHPEARMNEEERKVLSQWATKLHKGLE